MRSMRYARSDRALKETASLHRPSVSRQGQRANCAFGPTMVEAQKSDAIVEVLVEQLAGSSLRSAARLAGLFALLEALTSGFGQVIVPRMLVVSGDAAGTASNILAHARLVHISIAAGIVGAACHVAWTLLFYELFKPVSRTVSLLAAFVSLVAIALQAVSSILQIGPLIVLEAAPSLTAFTGDQLHALALICAGLTAHAFNVYLVFFGFWCVLIGPLIFRSGFLPRVLGVLETLSGLCWLTFLWLPFARYVAPYNQILAGVGELSLMGWLLVVGVRTSSASATARQQRP